MPPPWPPPPEVTALLWAEFSFSCGGTHSLQPGSKDETRSPGFQPRHNTVAPPRSWEAKCRPGNSPPVPLSVLPAVCCLLPRGERGLQVPGLWVREAGPQPSPTTALAHCSSSKGVPAWPFLCQESSNSWLPLPCRPPGRPAGLRSLPPTSYSLFVLTLCSRVGVPRAQGRSWCPLCREHEGRGQKEWRGRGSQPWRDLP